MLRAMPGDLAERLIAASELHGDFVLSSGRRSNVYFDKFRFLTDPDLLRDTADVAVYYPVHRPRSMRPPTSAV